MTTQNILRTLLSKIDPTAVKSAISEMSPDSVVALVTGQDPPVVSPPATAAPAPPKPAPSKPPASAKRRKGSPPNKASKSSAKPAPQRAQRAAPPKASKSAAKPAPQNGAVGMVYKEIVGQPSVSVPVNRL